MSGAVDVVGKIVNTAALIGEGIAVFRRARRDAKKAPRDITAPRPAEEAFRAMVARMERERLERWQG